jgi:hypothetical protein
MLDEPLYVERSPGCLNGLAGVAKMAPGFFRVRPMSPPYIICNQCQGVATVAQTVDGHFVIDCDGCGHHLQSINDSQAPDEPPPSVCYHGTMQPALSSDEIGELTDAIYRLAGDVGFDRLEEVPFDAWKKLQSLGMIERGPKGEPVLSEHGRKTHSRIESGLAVPEFDGDEPI